MLETVLKIGKAFRESPTGLKHHRYVKQCPQDTDKRKILRLSLPVNEDFRFDFNGIKEITDENIIRDMLFYPTFKTSDADGLVKYIFGDIYYSLSKGAEGGYYRLEDKTNKQKAYQVSSFFRGCEDFKSLNKMYEEQPSRRGQKESFSIAPFRREFEKNIMFIERLFKYHCGILEYLEFKNTGEATTFLELLTDEKELRRLTAKRVFSTIKQGRGAKKTFKNILDIEEPQWSLIESKEELIKKLIDYSTGDLFLHFDFNGKHWYEFANEFNIINAKMLEDFAERANTTDGYILKKYLYKTLSSPEKDIQFPSFSAQARYRSKLFKNMDEILDLIYAIDYSKTALLKIAHTDIKIVVLPRGKNLTATHYGRFIQRTSSLQNEQEQETIIGQENIEDTQEQLFAPLLENVAEDIIQFDLIFSKKGGQTAPDVDMVELSGVEKSHLREIKQRISKIKRTLYDKRQNEINAVLKPFSITWSFLNIFGDSTSDMKKYQSHLYKVLPQIYTGTYYSDAILLPALIEKTEANIRADKPDFKLLKYDFYFLTTIQNTILEGGNLMKIKESQSYRIGLLLGELAEQFAAWRDNCPIKSFEKSYVGTLSRRITTLEDLIRFKRFIEEKLVIHEKNFKSVKDISYELAQAIKNISGRYDKNECAFGFFESYFAPVS
ncbi:conserved hypothetical protein [Candidatus Brocadia pituitae]|nr:conserved hypothetical protein [Candidatus Brocadia pituitae]